jgi:urease accessory protein
VLSAAIRTAKEARFASESIGRQRAELCASLHQSALAAEYLRRAQEAGWPFSSAVSAALEGAVFDIPRDAMLAAIFHSSLTGLLAAAMKLLRIGQNGAQSLLAEALGGAGPAIALAKTLGLPEVGWFNPWLDIAAARHETAEARMFIS